MSIPLLDKGASPPKQEKLVTLYNINWGQFQTIEAQLTNNREVRLTYLAGVMEIMSPETPDIVWECTMSYPVRTLLKAILVPLGE